MKSAAFTVKVFGAYAALTGVTLLLAPNMLLVPLGFAPTTEPWVRIAGSLAIILGFHYWMMGSANVRQYFVLGVQGRLMFCAMCFGLVAFALAPPMLLLFGAIDAVAAMWTLMALRAEARS